MADLILRPSLDAMTFVNIYKRQLVNYCLDITHFYFIKNHFLNYVVMFKK